MSPLSQHKCADPEANPKDGLLSFGGVIVQFIHPIRCHGEAIVKTLEVISRQILHVLRRPCSNHIVRICSHNLCGDERRNQQAE